MDSPESYFLTTVTRQHPCIFLYCEYRLYAGTPGSTRIIIVGSVQVLFCPAQLQVVVSSLWEFQFQESAFIGATETVPTGDVEHSVDTCESSSRGSFFCMPSFLSLLTRAPCLA
ncbi:hypothetical protein PM082_008025 [Marasmius tenuissimus]|nr:hypothetical protein PM082_008025 [Marasmius tenuissimus]